jgi:hypothetical protein
MYPKLNIMYPIGHASKMYIQLSWIKMLENIYFENMPKDFMYVIKGLLVLRVQRVSKKSKQEKLNANLLSKNDLKIFANL